MNWHNDLRRKTRQPAFLWRMVISILVGGIVLGFVAQHFRSSGSVDAVVKNNAWTEIRLLAEQGEWQQVWWAIARHELSRHWSVGTTLLAALAGCCWLAFLLQAIQVRGFRDSRLWCALAALLLGALSIWPTEFFILWQEVGWRLQDSTELAPGLRYNILGVGLREELAKLLCLLPLMPWLLRLRSELTVLVVSACVGLGFSVVENTQYFQHSEGAVAIGRYLTANPAHITLTGLAGLAVYRGLRYPRGWGPQAIALFGVLVFAHGLYDAFIDIPALGDYALASTIIFVGLVYQFFHELRGCRSVRSETISLSANFLCGVSLLTAATFVYLSATLGCEKAFDVLAADVLGMSLMVYLFLREMPETMVTV